MPENTFLHDVDNILLEIEYNIIQPELSHDPVCTLFTLTRQKVYFVFLYGSIPNTISFVSLNINYTSLFEF